MTFDDEHHRLAIGRIEGLGDRPYDSVGLEHFAFTFGSLAELLGTYERLKAKGIEPIIPINHGGTTSLYYEDPDRNRVELQVDNFASWDEFDEFVKSGKLKNNFLGHKIDPEEMLAQLRAGVSEGELKAFPEDSRPDPDILERIRRN